MAMKAIVYSTPTCPWCARAKEFLEQRRVPFVDIDVSTDAAAAAEMVRRSGQQGVPVIVLGDEVIVGFDRPRIERLLEAGAARRVTFGAAVADASSYMAKRGMVPVFGAFVGKVTPGSPAEKAGLMPGDIITQIGIRPITNAEGVEKAIGAVEPGARVQVTYSRGTRQATRETIV
jgi:glutaredoxin-like YruB-family protein